MHSVSEWQTPDGTINQDMPTLSTYLQKWKLKFSITKKVITAFHRYNEARRK